jgi:hypothetical protein
MHIVQASTLEGGCGVVAWEGVTCEAVVVLQCTAYLLTYLQCKGMCWAHGWEQGGQFACDCVVLTRVRTC